MRLGRLRFLAVFSLVAILVAQFGTPGAGGEASPARAQEPEETELLERRSTYAKTYSLPDGSFRTRMSTAPIHFQDSVGNWLEIDNTLIPAEGGGYRNAANEFKVHFAASGDASELVRVEFEGKSVAFGLNGASPVTPQVSGSEITYPDILPNADVKFHVEGEMVKELIVLKAPPSAGQDTLNLSFPMKLGHLTSQELNDELTMIDSAGASVFSVPHLFMYDSLGSDTGGEPTLSENIQLLLNGAGTSPTLTAKVDANWLRDPDRVYPVTIDPTTINDRRPMLDTFVQSGISSGQSGSTELKSGYYSGPEGTFTAQSLIKFDLSDIPGGSTIDSAALQIFNNHSYNCSAPRTTEIRRVDGSWDHNVSWATKPPLASVVAASKSFAYGGTCPSGGARVDFNVQSLVSWWKNSTDPNHGFGVRAADQSDINTWRKYASNEATHVPWLDVVWSAPNRAPGLPTPISPTAGSATGAFPTLKATYNDPDSGDSGYVEYEIYQSGTCCGNPLRYGSSAQVSPGGTTSWSPTYALGDGDYTWRARSNDGLATSGWTSTIAFKVDTTAPAQPTISSSSHPNGTSCSTNNSPGFSWTGSDNSGGSGIAGYSYLIDRVQGTTPDTIMEGSGTSTSYSNVSDGDSWFHIRTRDNAGNWSTPAEYKINVNAIAPNPPSLTSSSHTSQTTWSTNDDPTFTWSLTDIFGINGYSYAIDQSSTTTPDTLSEGTGTSAAYSNLNDGEWYFHVRGRDGCNLWGARSDYRVRIDDTAPAAPSLSSSTHSSETTWYSHNDPTVAWSASDTSGIDGYSYVLDQSSTTQVDSISETSAASRTFTDVADGVWYVHARARNGSSLWSSETSHRRLQIDTTAPPAASLSSSTHPDQTLTYANDDPSFNWAAPVDVSGVTGYSFILDQVSTTSPDNTIDGTTTSKSYSNVAEGTSWFHLKTRDSAGNWSAVSHYKVSIETPAPMVNPILSAAFRDSTNEPVTKDGSQLTFSGPITQGSGDDAPADVEAQVTQCDLVARNDDGTVAKRIAVPLTTCRNSSGTLAGNYSPTFSIPTGTVQLEVKVDRTKNGITKTSGIQQSRFISIDNTIPQVSEALLGCWSDLVASCVEATTIVVGLSEPVTGGFSTADFNVSGNLVVSAVSQCPAVWCDEIALTVASPIDPASPPSVSYQFAHLVGRTRPVDAAQHALSDGSVVVRHPAPDPAEGDVDATFFPDDLDVEVLDAATSPLGEVVIVDSNALQVYADDDDPPAKDCLDEASDAQTDATHTKEEHKKHVNCEPTARERRLAVRISDLASGTDDEDGMPFAPDVIVLQEVNTQDAMNIAGRLNQVVRLGGQRCDVEPRCYHPAASSSKIRISETKNTFTVNETAILYNKRTITPLQKRTFQTFYSYDESCKPTSSSDGRIVTPDIDDDNDELADCRPNRRKIKQHWMTIFREKVSNMKVAVTSMHLVTPSHLKDETTDMAVKERWVDKAAKQLNRFASDRWATGADLYSIGGDFNTRRCVDRLRPELVVCAEKTWWRKLTAPVTELGHGYADAVWVNNRLQTEMNDQYRNGTRPPEDGRRIDFIFTRSASGSEPSGASRNYRCGIGFSLDDHRNTCKWLSNKQRYSDHLLLWAQAGG